MRVQFLGTAAAEAWPAIFCNCDTCNRVRLAKGKNLRSRSSIMIDDFYKIDIPPDTYHQMVRENLDLSALSALFITHSHSDHFCVTELEFLADPFAHSLKNPPVRIHGNRTVIERIKCVLADLIAQDRFPVELIEIEPFVPVKADHLTFTPVLASHMSNETCLNYVVQSDSSSFLYTADSGVYCDQTMEYLGGIKLDMLIAECTLGMQNYEPTGHMTFKAVLDLREKLTKYGTMPAGTRTIMTHFSHNIGMLHDEFEAIARLDAVEIAYDGLTVEV